MHYINYTCTIDALPEIPAINAKLDVGWNSTHLTILPLDDVDKFKLCNFFKLIKPLAKFTPFFERAKLPLY